MLGHRFTAPAALVLAGIAASLALGVPVAVAAEATTTSITAPTASVWGQPMDLTATVNAAAGTPAGTVQFKDGDADLGAPVQLDLAGTAKSSLPASDVGPRSITATYT